MASKENAILPDSIKHIPHIAAFDLLVKQRFDELELDRLLVYIIDSVDSSMLPYLASQFDVLGYKGMRLATNEKEQREIIKKAIELHRYKGTLWAVREALTSIGYGDALIEEHTGHWASFRITLDIGSHPLNVIEMSDVVKMIDEYKNERSHLADMSYTINFIDDSVLIADLCVDGEASSDRDAVTMGGTFRHNGNYYRNGARNYSSDSDILTIQII